MRTFAARSLKQPRSCTKNPRRSINLRDNVTAILATTAATSRDPFGCPSWWVICWRRAADRPISIRSHSIAPPAHPTAFIPQPATALVRFPPMATPRYRRRKPAARRPVPGPFPGAALAPGQPDAVPVARAIRI